MKYEIKFHVIPVFLICMNLAGYPQAVNLTLGYGIPAIDSKNPHDQQITPIIYKGNYITSYTLRVTDPIADNASMGLGIGVEKLMLNREISNTQLYENLNIDVIYFRIDMEPSLNPLKNIRRLSLSFPISFAWPLSSKASGVFRIYDSPDEVVIDVSNINHEFGNFNIYPGLGIAYQFDFFDSFGISTGIYGAYGIMSQSEKSTIDRIYHGGIRLSIIYMLPAPIIKYR